MGNSTAAQKFRDGIESKQSGIDDHEPEEELWTGDYSGKAMIGTWILIGLASIGLVAVSVVAPLDFRLLVWMQPWCWYRSRFRVPIVLRSHGRRLLP